MSLVTTPSSSSADKARHTVAIRELFPVPTGPATPNLNARVSGMEETHPLAGMLLGERVAVRPPVGGDVVGHGQGGHVRDQPLDLGLQVGEPAGRVERVD